MDAMEIHNQDNILDNDLMLINFRVKQFYLMPFFQNLPYWVFKKVPGVEEAGNIWEIHRTIQNHFSVTSINTLLGTAT